MYDILSATTRAARLAATRIAAALVTVVAAGAGGLLGALAVWLHPRQPATGLGLALGVGSGLAAGAAWLLLMRRVARARLADVATWGTAGGLGAGSLSALAVHAGMAFTSPSPHPLRDLLLGQVFGLGAGAILGCLGGLGWRAACLVSQRPTSPRVESADAATAAPGASRAARLRSFAGAAVLLASSASSALLGRRLGYSYRWDVDAPYLFHPRAVQAGTWLGAAVGLAAGAGWIGWMRRRGARSGRDAVLARGVRASLVAGALAASALQLGLQFAFSWRDALARQLLGELLTLGPSLLLGLVGGALWAAASPAAPPPDRPPD